MAAEKLYYDVSLVAYLSLSVHEEPQAVVVPGGRVAFKFRSDLQNALGNFYGDAPVPIQSYIGKVREIRSLIFAMKETS